MVLKLLILSGINKVRFTICDLRLKNIELIIVHRTSKIVHSHVLITKV